MERSAKFRIFKCLALRPLTRIVAPICSLDVSSRFLGMKKPVSRIKDVVGSNPIARSKLHPAHLADPSDTNFRANMGLADLLARRLP